MFMHVDYHEMIVGCWILYSGFLPDFKSSFYVNSGIFGLFGVKTLGIRCVWVFASIVMLEYSTKLAKTVAA